MFDEIDHKILTILNERARIPVAEMARQVGLSPAGVHNRVRRLEESGVVRGYATRLDPVALGHPLLAFVAVTLGVMRRADEVALALRAMGEVLEVHHTVGEACFLLKVRCPDTGALEDLLARINDLPPVRATTTTVVLRTSKDEANPPLPGGAGAAGPAGKES